MAKMCAFCSADAVEKGGEHIWDDWIDKAQPKKSLYRARKRYAIDSPTIEYPTARIGEQLPVVCSECNSGWMSVLTHKIKQTFSRAILHGEPFRLDARGAALLASFSFMKAVITNHALPDDPFFTRAARERFRTSLTIPPLVQCWFAAYQGEFRFSTKNSMSIFGQNDPESPICGMEFCSHSYVVGNLALQLLAPRWKRIDHRGRGLLMVDPAAMWSPAAIRFWPSDGTALSWPPPKYLSSDAIEIFIKRFGNSINIEIPRSGAF
jgi:hypothetical protein